MACPTVRIESNNEDGYVVINESDFDPSKHTAFDPESKRLAAEAEAQRLKDEADAEAKRLADKSNKRR